MAVAFRDYYETLGIARDASPDDVRSAYRKLARRYHPDVNKQAGTEDRFKEISEAYEVLRDPEKRERYDRLGADWKAGDDVSGAGGFADFAQRSGAGDVRVEFGSSDFSDFFESFFGGRGQGARGVRFDGFPQRGSDHEVLLELSLGEAAAGGRRHLSLADGRQYDVNIPRGVRDGQRIRLAGEGSKGARGGTAGDLFLRVRIKPDPRLRLEGRDLYVDVSLAPWEAALGAGVKVPTLDGSARLRVPHGSSSGRKLRLRGKGMPGPRGGHGDLYAVVRIEVPKTLTAEERELFERLASVSSFDPRAENSKTSTRS